MTNFYGLIPSHLRIGALLCLIVTTSASHALGSENRRTSCQFDSSIERTKNSPVSRAAYTALQWVEYEDKALRVQRLVKDMTNVPGTSQAQIVMITVASWTALQELSSTYPLHKCFEETFTSDKSLDTYFAGMVFVKGRLTLDAPYAMVIPRNSSDPVVLIMPTSTYRFQQSSGNLRVFDTKSQEYVDVDPQARRGVDHLIQVDQLIQTNLALAKLKNQK
ncbi:MAG: hypothetical protein J0L82_03495 [Deltaproteobacteria bacterium]|nr:hypothetical protein [Deltaproteobacteria bacterium]